MNTTRTVSPCTDPVERAFVAAEAHADAGRVREALASLEEAESLERVRHANCRSSFAVLRARLGAPREAS